MSKEGHCLQNKEPNTGYEKPCSWFCHAVIKYSHTYVAYITWKKISQN